MCRCRVVGPGGGEWMAGVRRVAVVSLVFVGVLFAFAVPVRAALTSEASTTWIEYGNTRVHGVFVGDAGGTSGPEVVTAGEAVTDSTGTVKAQLRRDRVPVCACGELGR